MIIKWKRNKNLKITRFWQYVTVQIVLTESADKSNYRFPSIVKNNGKEGLKLSKVRREKWLAQIFRKDLTERKLERTRWKIMLSASPSSVFFTQSSQYQIWKANVYILSNSNQTWTTTVRVLNLDLKVLWPTYAKYKFHKKRIEIWLSIGFKMGFPWLRTYFYNHYTMFNIYLVWWGSLKLLCTHFQRLRIILEIFHFP